MKKQTKSKQIEVPRRSPLSIFVNVLVWLVGIIVALAVGSGMIVSRIPNAKTGLLEPVLTIPYIPAVVTQITGWVVVIGAILSLILAIFDR